MTRVMLVRLYLAGLAAVAIVAASPVAAGSATGSNAPAVPATDCPVRAELGRACLFNPAADITGGRVSRY